MDYKMFKVSAVILIFTTLVMVSVSYPLLEDGDLEPAATGGEHHGRVQIKVYRGPTEHSGHDYFAPWGYWVKQPADH